MYRRRIAHSGKLSPKWLATGTLRFVSHICDVELSLLPPVMVVDDDSRDAEGEEAAIRFLLLDLWESFTR